VNGLRPSQALLTGEFLTFDEGSKVFVGLDWQSTAIIVDAFDLRKPVALSKLRLGVGRQDML
jgi:hypothetical protein